jgi:hypothetical protein
MTEHEKLWFPKYWVIKKTDDKRIDDFIDWFNKYYSASWCGDYTYCWYEWTSGCGWTNFHNYIDGFENNPTIITLDQWEKRTKQKKSHTKLSSPIRSCSYDNKTRTSDTIDWIKITDLKEQLQTNENINKEINKIMLQHRNLFSNPNK